MRRLLSEATAYLSHLGRSALRGWNDFFFCPADPTALGLIRIAVGLLAFWSLFVFGLDLHDYLGSTGWAEPGVIRSRGSADVVVLVPRARQLAAAGLVCLPGNPAAFCAGPVQSSDGRTELGDRGIDGAVRVIALYGFDQVLSTLALYLALPGASGQAVSFDRFLSRWRQARSVAKQPIKRGGGPRRRLTGDETGRPEATVSANLALRLIQLHLALIYGMAGLAKLQGPSWWDGTAIWRTMATGEFVVFDFTWLAAWPVLINLITHGSLALEVLYPLLVWIRLARPLVLAGIVILHVGIAVMSPGLTEFALVMMAGNLAFVPGKWLRRVAVGTSQPGLRVLYDGACPRCRSSMALITAADPDHLVEPLDLTTVDLVKIHATLRREDCMKSMHAVSDSGRITRGFDAMRTSRRGCLYSGRWP